MAKAGDAAANGRRRSDHLAGVQFISPALIKIDVGFTVVFPLLLIGSMK